MSNEGENGVLYNRTKNLAVPDALGTPFSCRLPLLQRNKMVSLFTKKTLKATMIIVYR